MAESHDGSTSGITSSDAQVERLLEEYVARTRRGENPSITEYVVRAPGLEARIREALAAAMLLRAGEEARGDSHSSSLAAATTSRTLQKLGDYRLLREIGRGGMGVVYEGVQESLGRRVAVKVLPESCLLDARRVERFRAEARAAARLQHPNIVPVHDVGDHEGILYFAMEYVPGESLDRVIGDVRELRRAADSSAAGRDTSAASKAPSGASSSAWQLLSGEFGGQAAAPRDASHTSWSSYYLSVARLGRQIADALEHAHQHGVLHRDIKPANILLHQGRACVADFGLAKVAGDEDLTRTGELVGTVRYMAPKRFRGWCDHRADVYSLGVTLYELLALRPAFNELDRACLVRRISEEGPAPLRRAAPGVPGALERVVRKAIQIDPDRRYSSAAELALDLGRFLDAQDVLAPADSTLERLSERLRRRPLRAATLLMTAGLLLGLLLGVWLSRGVDPGTRDSDRTAREALPTPAPRHPEILSLPVSGVSPIDLAAGDFDQDGDDDLAAVNMASSDVNLLRNEGQRRFELLPGSLEVSQGPFGVAACDLDGDLRLDLATASGQGRSLTLLRDPMGKEPRPAVTLAMEIKTFRLTAADPDGSGKLSLFVSAEGNRVRTVDWQPEGMLRLTGSIPVGPTPMTVLLADVDGDKDSDLGAACQHGGRVAIALHQGQGQWSAPRSTTVPGSPVGLVAGDVDGDAVIDLIASVLEVGDLYALHGKGDGTYAEPTRLPLPAGSGDLALADLDRDGDLDLLAANERTQALHLLVNGERGAFAAARRLGTGGPAYGLVVRDLDSDGVLEAVITNGSNNELAVLSLRHELLE